MNAWIFIVAAASMRLGRPDEVQFPLGLLKETEGPSDSEAGPTATQPQCLDVVKKLDQLIAMCDYSLMHKAINGLLPSESEQWRRDLLEPYVNDPLYSNIDKCQSTSFAMVALLADKEHPFSRFERLERITHGDASVWIFDVEGTALPKHTDIFVEESFKKFNEFFADPMKDGFMTIIIQQAPTYRDVFDQTFVHVFTLLLCSGQLRIIQSWLDHRFTAEDYNNQKEFFKDPLKFKNLFTEYMLALNSDTDGWPFVHDLRLQSLHEELFLIRPQGEVPHNESMIKKSYKVNFYATGHQKVDIKFADEALNRKSQEQCESLKAAAKNATPPGGYAATFQFPNDIEVENIEKVVFSLPELFHGYVKLHIKFSDIDASYEEGKFYQFTSRITLNFQDDDELKEGLKQYGKKVSSLAISVVPREIEIMNGWDFTKKGCTIVFKKIEKKKNEVKREYFEPFKGTFSLK